MSAPQWGSLKVWTKLLGCYSRWLYLVSTSAKDLLTKNTSLLLLSSQSLNKAALTVTSETDKYMKSVSSASRLASTRGSSR